MMTQTAHLIIQTLKQSLSTLLYTENGHGIVHLDRQGINTDMFKFTYNTDTCVYNNHFPHMTTMQQMTLKISFQKYIESFLHSLWQKGKCYHQEQFLLLPQCFLKSSAADTFICIYMWERVNI